MRVKLSDITKYSKGVQINGDDLVSGGKYIYLNGGISPSGRWNEANVKGNTVTISEGGNSSGYINYITEPFWCGAHCYYLYNGPKNTKYLYYALKSQQERLFAIRSGACMPNIKKADLGNFEFEFDFDEKRQDDIVACLDKAKRIIEVRQHELQLFDELIKARFVEMFRDGQSPIKPVEELCSEIVDCPHTTPKYEGELKNPAIRTSEIKKGYITWESMRYVSDEEYEERVARLRPKAGDIVYGREGTFGNAAVLPEGYNFCLGQRVMLLRPNYSKCTSEYLLHAVISDDIYRQALEKNNASTVAHINVKSVKQFRIPLPSFDKQNQFAAFVKQIDKSKFVVQQALDEAQLLFDSLMQEYFG